MMMMMIIPGKCTDAVMRGAAFQAAARPGNSGDEYVAQLSWFCGDDYQQLMVAVIVG